MTQWPFDLLTQPASDQVGISLLSEALKGFEPPEHLARTKVEMHLANA